MIEVLDKFKWEYGKSNIGGSTGLIAQVTTCRHDGVVFYVRENTTGINSFEISSGERWGDKIGKQPRRVRQVLELHAPNGNWAKIAVMVHEADPMKRAVIRNKRFTLNWIKNYKLKP